MKFSKALYEQLEIFKDPYKFYIEDCENVHSYTYKFNIFGMS